MQPIEFAPRLPLWNVLGKFQKTVMAATSILIVGMICYTVIARYVFGSDFYGSEELIQMLAFWLYFMGAAQGSREKSQISADILTCYVTNAKWCRIAQLVKDVVTVAICLLVTYWACLFVGWGIQMMPKSPVFRLPMLIPHTAIGLGFVLMSLYHVVYLIQDFMTHIKMCRAGE
ncbi:TRAP transporter small permease [Pseudodesulfovibrio sp. zrk46]|uniref:TRAP transporter small permease n=1 Tax=Pseudodesulfovibrio sp. zrk46 TaxID=2725288 RepID=UPI001449D393|nr:TRAP transporter small permease [Pseudodesulfovibrio sp. zrk46]QJB57380.1 TRAP transporter small permease [Pseudodesulfovibrio sp. zrk46]